MFMQPHAQEWGDFLTLGQAACWFGKSVQWVCRQRGLLDLGGSHRLYHLRCLQSFHIAQMLGLDQKTMLRFQGAALADFYNIPREVAPDEAEHIAQLKRFYEPLPAPTQQTPLTRKKTLWDALDNIWNRLTRRFKPYRYFGTPRPWAKSHNRAPPCSTRNPYPCMTRNRFALAL